MLNTTIAHYKITAKLGQGGMALGTEKIGTCPQGVQQPHRLLPCGLHPAAEALRNVGKVGPRCRRFGQNADDEAAGKWTVETAEAWQGF